MTSSRDRDRTFSGRVGAVSLSGIMRELVAHIHMGLLLVLLALL